MKEIIIALSNTPAWVYLLFAYFIWVGMKASKARVIPIKKLFFMPLIFTAMSVHTLITAFNVGFLEISVWSIAIIFGILLGWFDVYRKHLHFKIDKEKHLIQLPGSWVTLIIILVIFASKYYFAYELEADPALSHQSGFELSMLSVSGICAGLVIGRLVSYLYQYQKSAHTTLRD